MMRGEFFHLNFSSFFPFLLIRRILEFINTSSPLSFLPFPSFGGLSLSRSVHSESDHLSVTVDLSLESRTQWTQLSFLSPDSLQTLSPQNLISPRNLCCGLDPEPETPARWRGPEGRGARGGYYVMGIELKYVCTGKEGSEKG